jgi:hypothetical protein
MKRRLLALLLAVLTLTMLTAAAFAEDTEVLGVYNVTGPLTVTNGTKDGGFYAGADTFELNCTGLTGEYSLVLLLEGDNKVPTSSNIQYIDQLTVENDGTAKFTLRPKALTEGTYNVYISTTDKALDKVASFKYGTKPPYTLGDVNNDGSIDAADALLVLQHAVGQEGRILTGTYFSAADINKDSVVDAVDALLILKRAAGLTTDF